MIFEFVFETLDGRGMPFARIEHLPYMRGQGSEMDQVLAE
jgi:hypothetical protein